MMTTNDIRREIVALRDRLEAIEATMAQFETRIADCERRLHVPPDLVRQLNEEVRRSALVQPAETLKERWARRKRLEALEAEERRTTDDEASRRRDDDALAIVAATVIATTFDPSPSPSYDPPSPPDPSPSFDPGGGSSGGGGASGDY
jgi:hypothetical protein